MDEFVRLSIQETLPTAHGQRHKRLFEFLRRLKGRPELADADYGAIEPYVRAWHAQALPRIRTKSFDLTALDAGEGWENIRHPFGQNALTAAVQGAMASPLPAEAQRFDSRTMQLLVAICKQLAAGSPDGHFFLSSRSAGEAIGVCHVTAARCLKHLVRCGLLVVANQGTLAGRQATVYRYLDP